MSQIILIRPGCTEFDEQHRIQGNLDLPLSTGGRQQVERLLADLENVEIDYLFSSPCEPARSTAEALGMARGISVREVEGLHNVNHGLWQGLKVEDVRRKHPKVFKQWQESPEAICPPGGELLTEAVARVRKALEKPLKKKGNLAIVAADPLASIICALIKGLPLAGMVDRRLAIDLDLFSRGGLRVLADLKTLSRPGSGSYCTRAQLGGYMALEATWGVHYDAGQTIWARPGETRFSPLYSREDCLAAWAAAWTGYVSRFRPW